MTWTFGFKVWVPNGSITGWKHATSPRVLVGTLQRKVLVCIDLWWLVVFLSDKTPRKYVIHFPWHPVMSYSQIQVGVFNYLPSIIFGFHFPISEGDWTPRVSYLWSTKTLRNSRCVEIQYLWGVQIVSLPISPWSKKHVETAFSFNNPLRNCWIKCKEMLPDPHTDFIEYDGFILDLQKTPLVN